MLSLRNDLDLLESDRARDGSQRWVLRDPVNNRFFKLGNDEIQIMAYLKDVGVELDKIDNLGGELSRHFGRMFDAEQVKDFILFLRQNNLLQVNGPEARAMLRQQREQMQPGVLRTVLRNYLFLKFHLLRPNRLLDLMLPWCRWFYRRPFWLLILLNTLFGVYLTSRQWDTFISSFIGYLNIPGMVAIGIALALVKIMHEFGHAVSTRYYGCSVNSMGIAFLLFWPILFTDTTDAWRLKDKKQRALIGVSGVLVELVVASICLTWWNFADEGMLKSVLFVLASTTWILTLAINLNPLMRFDGYFVLADVLGVDNLQERSFAQARWQLREWMFGFGYPPPERTSLGLIIFAFCVWIYRFLLYFGIALIIYNYFFKLLGVVLMSVQLYTLMVKPLSKELLYWWKHRERSRLMPNVTISFLLLAALIIWLVFPSQGTLSLPAYSRAPQTMSVYVQEPGLLKEVVQQDTAVVGLGDKLVEFAMPDLEYALEDVERDIALLEAQLRTLGVSRTPNTPRGAIIAELRSARQQQAQLRERLSQREIVAPFAGVVRDLADDITLHQWVGKGKKLMVLVQEGQTRVVGYVNEQNIDRVQVGQRARFYAHGGVTDVLELEVVSIETFPVNALEELYVASSHGGGLQVRDNSEEPDKLSPQQASYRVYLRADGVSQAGRALRGSVVLNTDRVSPIARYWRTILALWRREAGF